MVEGRKLLSVTQAAKYLGLSRNTVLNYADSGKLPVLVLPSGHRRFDVNALDAWLRRHERAEEVGA